MDDGRIRWNTLGRYPCFVYCVHHRIYHYLYFGRATKYHFHGEETAIILGVQLDRLNRILLVSVSVMVGAIVSISGSIGFVGLIIPHIVRKLIGSDHKN